MKLKNLTNFYILALKIRIHFPYKNILSDCYFLFHHFILYAYIRLILLR